MKELFVKHPLSDKCVALTTTTALGNLAYQVDEGKGVKERRNLLAELLFILPNRFTYVHQSHSDRVMKVTTNDLGKGKDAFEDGMECDALYTYERNVPLCIFHADCVPIFFINEKASLVGIIHAGFKGTMKHVAYKAINEVINNEGLDIKDFKFYIGPFRQKESFEVDATTKQAIIEAGFEKTIIGDHFDNGLANVLDLYKLGVKEEQITVSNYDTVSDDRFYSAYLKTPVGRLVSLIYLK
ncbi:MAG: laccase domain-containing protein [Bacilli bacterium]|nr:laccase domain-containing protein [Bacilli bacterium]